VEYSRSDLIDWLRRLAARVPAHTPVVKTESGSAETKLCLTVIAVCVAHPEPIALLPVSLWKHRIATNSSSTSSTYSRQRKIVNGGYVHQETVCLQASEQPAIESRKVQV
jgi:hypothetical protein